MLAEELGAVLLLLLLAAGLQSTNLPFPVGKGFSLVFPLLASGLGVILVRKLHSTSGLSDFLACSENCVRNVRGLGSCGYISFGHNDVRFCPL